MFKVKGVKKTFRQDFWSPKFTALDNVEFEVSKGDIVGFLGANGAGKTTLLKILMGFIPSDEGVVEFCPSLGSNNKEIFKKIGFLPERPYFYPHLKGRDFVSYVAQLSDVSKSLTLERMNSLAKEFKIDHALNREIRGYSKGMLQRLGFVATLIHDPEVIILDEPLSGLDPVGRKEIKDHLVKLNKDGKTVFFSSHIVSDIEEICTKTVVLNKGKLTYEGPIKELIERNNSDKVFITFSKDVDISSLNTISHLEMGDLLRIEIENKNKEEIIKSLVSDGVIIEEIKNENLTLEEVIYEI
jgi:ABC-2 type transport system ATP-binding protein